MTESTFENVNLSTIDPSAAELPPDTYSLQVAKAEIKEFEYKNGDKAGQKGQYVQISFAVTDSDRYSGRRIFQPNMFMNGGTLKQFRKIMDATGIEQGDATFNQWLGDLVSQRATFRAPVELVEDKDQEGNPKKVLKVNLWQVAPVA